MATSAFFPSPGPTALERFGDATVGFLTWAQKCHWEKVSTDGLKLREASNSEKKILTQAET